jgi:hypothetical protein
MDLNKIKKDIPVGYIRVHKHTLPENDKVYYTFSKWNGKTWNTYNPSNIESDSLIQAKTNSAGDIYNIY